MSYNAPASRVIAAAAGATPRQIDHWCRRGLVPGQEPGMGRGNYRRWTPEQIDRLRKIAYAVRQAEDILASVGLSNRGHVQVEP